MLPVTASLAAMAAAGPLIASEAVNRAQLTLPAGTEDTDLSNNTAMDSDSVLAVLVASDDSAPVVYSGAGGEGIINAFANDTINGEAFDPAAVIASVVTPAEPIDGGSAPALDPSTGLVSVPPDTPAGSYTITYSICEAAHPDNCASASVTVVVEPARSNLSGTVYLDVDSDREVDQSDMPKEGWIVEVMQDGALVATTTTDAEGNYMVEDLPAGPGYSVQFRNPETKVVYGTIDNVELKLGETVVDQDLPIDPSGVVYNSVTRQPVAGAQVSITDSSGAKLPLECLVDPSQQDQLTDALGNYRFDIRPGASAQCPKSETAYRITVTPPAGYSFVSTVLPPEGQPLNPTGSASPFMVSTAAMAPVDAEPVYYLTFLLEQGDPHVVNNHIPLDPFLSRTPLIVTKTSPRRSASRGDLVPYEITVRNPEAVQRAGVDVIDVMPPGMKYVEGTATVDGAPSEPERANGGRELVWRGQTIPGNGAARYNLTLIVGAGVSSGARVNTGLAENGADGAEISNRGQASIAIQPSSVFDCTELIGKVFEDTNRNGYQDEGEPGVPSARLATVNGQLVTTDEFGRYHIACASVPDSRIGSNFVLKLDLRTVPLAWQSTTDNPASIRLTRGKMGELNFGVAPPPEDGAAFTESGGR